ncbi:type II toxin-antitoxin system HipA family toxin [Sulfurimonas sp.]|jgi:serine/threonine-protein kinase HipA|uniref:type II toxin-antitoxin system HipA family toxin n=1 Tax=Sulfurimonas sp. TaxID=2022749 RepID=UPI0025F8C5BE|nr:type II toxin-antitoxin system HipA family toxin [Sulfurimonas sp.]MBT5934383.1 type II toxin-antitoxin system HipA family toxin [Sulfurimonas sp.]
MEITVKAWGERVAKLKEVDGISYFSFAPDCKQNFSPIKMPTKGKTYEFSHLAYQRGLPGLINDSLPGVYGKEFLDEFFMKHFKYTPSYLETLQFLGENTMGALSFEPGLDIKEKRSNLILDATELYSETKAALRGEADFSIKEVIAISNSAASGARPKAIVGYNPNNEKMFVSQKYKSLPDGYKHSIVKFDNLLYKSNLNSISSKEIYSQTKAEYLYSLVAKRVGIKMPNTHLVELDGHSHFVVERFDISLENSELKRYHMHSLSGLMHQNPAETTFDYTNLFRLGDNLNIPHQDKIQFFKTMIFNWIFGNKDDHTRNFSYLMDSDGKWRGSPAYDLTFSTNTKHQMMFNYIDGYSLTRKDIINIGQEFGLNGAEEIIDTMIDAKHTYLLELCIQYNMKNWYKDILQSTSHIKKNAK